MAEGPIRIANDIKQDKWISRWEGITQALLLPSHGIPPHHGRVPSRSTTSSREHEGRSSLSPFYFFNFIFNFMTLPTTKKKKEIFSFLIDSLIFFLASLVPLPPFQIDNKVPAMVLTGIPGLI